MTTITITDLRQMPSGASACDEALEWFAGAFPDGAPLADAWDACPDDEWRIWFAAHWLPEPERRQLAFRFAGQAFRFAAQVAPALAEYADNVTAENRAAAEAAAGATAEAAWDAEAAARDAAWAAWDAEAAARDAAWAAAWDAWAAARDAADAWAAEAAWDAGAAAWAAAARDARADAWAAAAREQLAWCAEALGLRGGALAG